LDFSSTFVPNPFVATAPQWEQDIKQVWFASVHADIGGGYPENESGLSKFPLDWMIELISQVKRMATPAIFRLLFPQRRTAYRF
jgi:hypothetical protein